MRGRSVVAALAAAGLVALAASGEALAGTSLTARGSVEQVQVTGATPGAGLKLLRKGERSTSGRRASSAAPSSARSSRAAATR